MDFNDILKKFKEEVEKIKEFDIKEAKRYFENLKVKYLGRKEGIIPNLFKKLREVPPEKRKEFGQKINLIKEEVEKALKEYYEFLKQVEKEEKLKKEYVDVTIKFKDFEAGSLHPVTKTLNRIVEIFTNMGFAIADGPEIELDFYNFEALNIPKGHPAREMQDTFYITNEILPRTHTSPIQIRTMLSQKPPIQIIAPGKVYRRDSDPTHTPMFHQVEGLLIDKKATFTDLMGILNIFLKEFFGKDTKVRFRPSYFPFTEPSAEVDIGCVICKGKGCRVCKGTGWLEVLGCGMVHENVLKNANIDPEKYQGFAFGMGVERLTMLKYGIDDIRLLFENDVRFLRQFKPFLA